LAVVAWCSSTANPGVVSTPRLLRHSIIDFFSLIKGAWRNSTIDRLALYKGGCRAPFLAILLPLSCVAAMTSTGNKRAKTPSQSNPITNYMGAGAGAKRPRTATVGSSRPPLPPGSHRLSGGAGGGGAGSVYVAPSQLTQAGSASQDLLPLADRRGSSEAALGWGKQYWVSELLSKSERVHERGWDFCSSQIKDPWCCITPRCQVAGLAHACFVQCHLFKNNFLPARRITAAPHRSPPWRQPSGFFF